MTKNQALDVLDRFDLARVRRQIAWMQYCGAKNPSRYLMAAIESDYDAPVAVRLQQAGSGEEAASTPNS